MHRWELGTRLQRARTSVVLALVATVVVGGATVVAANRTYRAHLTGSEEVPARATQAQGQSTFKLSKDGTALEYKLNVANIENVTAAHIHLGAAGANGPVVASLYGNVPAGGGRVNGRLSEGTITAANLVGPLAGQPLSALVAKLESGEAYVNVHTNNGVAPINTGPGDFPGGEIRGQIR